MSIDKTLHEAVELLPPAWHYPEITCARIILYKLQFTSGDFRETAWRQASDILIGDQREGIVEVFYLEEKPSLDEGPFLKEERSMIEEIAKKIASFVETRRMDEKLQDALYKAESANRAKSEFLATMSHEIRTPLNAILGMGELLTESKLTETQEWCVKTLNRSGETLLTLINDILDLSKIEAGELKLERVPMDIRRLLEETMDLFTFTALDKRIKLNHSLNESVPTLVVGDATRLRQVLLNLVNNAVKFTTDGSVKVSVEAMEGDRISFAVTDTGPGIPADMREAIFQPFTQADTSITRKHGGTGLGLTICQRLVRLMDGTMELESSPGQGSSFYFTVPLPQVQEVTAAGNKEDVVSTVESHRLKPAVAKQSIKILLVDDAEENLLLIQAFLKNEPYQLVICENGSEAVETFKTERFDLVFMDIQMPVMDGYEATRRIRAWEHETRAEPTPIVALTAHAMVEESEKIKAVGCDMHLTKPVRKQRLLDTVGKFT